MSRHLAFLPLVVVLLVGGCARQPAPQPASAEPVPPELATEEQRGAYAIGQQLGKTVANMGYPALDVDLLVAGLRDALSGTSRLADDELQAGLAGLARRAHAARGERDQRLAREGQAFLQRNRAREGVVETPSGLQYEVLDGHGSGPHPGPTDRVVVHYVGKLIDDTVFDSSVARGQPAEFPLNRVIRGWTEGLQLMRKGDRYRFFIPSELAYGERGAGDRIPPHAVLIFDVELLDVKAAGSGAG